MHPHFSYVYKRSQTTTVWTHSEPILDRTRWPERDLNKLPQSAAHVRNGPHQSETDDPPRGAGHAPPMIPHVARFGTLTPTLGYSNQRSTKDRLSHTSHAGAESFNAPNPGVAVTMSTPHVCQYIIY